MNVCEMYLVSRAKEQLKNYKYRGDTTFRGANLEEFTNEELMKIIEIGTIPIKRED